MIWVELALRQNILLRTLPRRISSQPAACRAVLLAVSSVCCPVDLAAQSQRLEGHVGTGVPPWTVAYCTFSLLYQTQQSTRKVHPGSPCMATAHCIRSKKTCDEVGGLGMDQACTGHTPGLASWELRKCHADKWRLPHRRDSW